MNPLCVWRRSLFSKKSWPSRPLFYSFIQFVDDVRRRERVAFSKGGLTDIGNKEHFEMPFLTAVGDICLMEASWSPSLISFCWTRGPGVIFVSLCNLHMYKHVGFLGTFMDVKWKSGNCTFWQIIVLIDASFPDFY